MFLPSLTTTIVIVPFFSRCVKLKCSVRLPGAAIIWTIQHRQAAHPLPRHKAALLLTGERCLGWSCPKWSSLFPEPPQGPSIPTGARCMHAFIQQLCSKHLLCAHVHVVWMCVCVCVWTSRMHFQTYDMFWKVGKFCLKVCPENDAILSCIIHFINFPMYKEDRVLHLT